MQTRLSKSFLQTAHGREADGILRSCVHCGFCTATCPTYQLLGDELDGPRGRIYLMKQMFESQDVSRKTQQHLDRCLSCRSCETTCPSGVRYGRLVDIGREYIEHRVTRDPLTRARRFLLRKIVPYPKRFGALLATGRLFRPLMPRSLRNKVPDVHKAGSWPTQRHERRMLIFPGCAQSVVNAQTNVSTANVLARLGIEVRTAPASHCCGAVSHHLAASEEALGFMRRNIDAWWEEVESGVEAIVITASGCGVMLKDYGELLKHDSRYADKAQRISSLCKDISEILQHEELPSGDEKKPGTRVAYHSPCTLQHGLKQSGVVENILRKAGYRLTDVENPHLCCGSAGTYSILQPELSKQLLTDKLSALQREQPDVIATANIGCQMHLASDSNMPVVHWIELVEEALG